MSQPVGPGQSPSSPGHCPECKVPVPSVNVLVEYETNEGWHRVFAECPVCEDVIHPAES